MGRERDGRADKVRQAWYARQRQRRFARFLGFEEKPRDAASSPTADAGRPRPRERDGNDHGAGRAADESDLAPLAGGQTRDVR